jgi:hypothetical protein
VRTRQAARCGDRSLRCGAFRSPISLPPLARSSRFPITWRWHLQTDAKIDLTPSLHWAAPVVSHEIANDRGPVLVTVEYRIDPAKRRTFLAALDRLGRERRRDGAYRWGVFEDTADPSRLVETFLVDS